MIYCLGNKDCYDNYIETDPKAAKLGRREAPDKWVDKPYAGGSVWKTYEEAKACRDSLVNPKFNYDIYGVEADWDTETALSWDIEVNYHDLLVDAKFRR